MKNTFFVEVVWNREFHWVPFGAAHTTIESAIQAAKTAENMGDGESVKKAHVIDVDGNVVWAYGKRVSK